MEDLAKELKEGVKSFVQSEKDTITKPKKEKTPKKEATRKNHIRKDKTPLEDKTKQARQFFLDNIKEIEKEIQSAKQKVLIDIIVSTKSVNQYQKRVLIFNALLTDEVNGKSSRYILGKTVEEWLICYANDKAGFPFKIKYSFAKDMN